MSNGLTILPTDALIVIDMQQDFLPREAGFEGALGVSGGDQLLQPIEQIAAIFEHVILTADWHPPGHISFASTHQLEPFAEIEAYGAQALWPDHCVQSTRGADIAVSIPHAELILRKGFRRAIDSYSAFLENDHLTPTGLAGYLRERQLQRLFFCGLAFDFCVGSSAVDGSRMGFECIVLEDLTRAVDLPGSVASMHARLAANGVPAITAARLSP
jgi:nicotinamidase/pyrazinamidase